MAAKKAKKTGEKLMRGMSLPTNTSEIAVLPLGKKLIGRECVFKTEHKPNGEVGK